MKKYLFITIWLLFGGLYIHLIKMVEEQFLSIESFLLSIFLIIITSIYVGTTSNLIKVPAKRFTLHWNKFIKLILGVLAGIAIVIAGILVSALNADFALQLVGTLISIGGIIISIEFSTLVGSTFEKMRVN